MRMHQATSPALLSIPASPLSLHPPPLLWIGLYFSNPRKTAACKTQLRTLFANFFSMLPALPCTLACAHHTHTHTHAHPICTGKRSCFHKLRAQPYHIIRPHHTFSSPSLPPISVPFPHPSPLPPL